MSKNITYQNLWDTVNAMLKIKLIVGSPADSVVHVTLDLRVMRLRPTLGIELTWKKRFGYVNCISIKLKKNFKNTKYVLVLWKEGKKRGKKRRKEQKTVHRAYYKGCNFYPDIRWKWECRLWYLAITTSYFCEFAQVS